MSVDSPVTNNSLNPVNNGVLQVSAFSPFSSSFQPPTVIQPAEVNMSAARQPEPQGHL